MTESTKKERSEDWESLLARFSDENEEVDNNARDESYLVACIMMLTSHSKSSDAVIFEAFTSSRFAEKLHEFLHRLIQSCLDDDRNINELYLRLALQCLSVVYAKVKTDYDQTLSQWSDRHTRALCDLLKGLTNRCVAVDIKRILPTLLLYRLTHFKELGKQENLQDKNWISHFIEWIMIERLIPCMNQEEKHKIDANNTAEKENVENETGAKTSENDQCDDGDKDDHTLCRLLKSLLKPLSRNEIEKSDCESMSYWINCFHLSLLSQIPLQSSDEQSCHTILSYTNRNIFYQSCRNYFDTSATTSIPNNKDKEELWTICMFLLLQIYNPTIKNDSEYDLETETDFLMEMCVIGMTWQIDTNSLSQNHKEELIDEPNLSSNNIRQMAIHVMAELCDRYGLSWMLQNNKRIGKLHDTTENSEPFGPTMSYCTLLRLVVGEIRIVMGGLVAHEDKKNNDTLESSLLMESSTGASAIIAHGVRFALVGLKTMSEFAMEINTDDFEKWSIASIQHVEQSLDDLAHSSQEYILLFGRENIENSTDNIMNVAQMQCISYLGAFYSQVDLDWNWHYENERRSGQSYFELIEPTLLAIGKSILFVQQFSVNSSENKNQVTSKGHQSILCLIPCLISILSQSIAHYPNPFHNDIYDDYSNITHLIYSEFFQKTKLMESTLIDYMIKDVIQSLISCKEGDEQKTAIISSLSWCFLLVDTWCQFMTNLQKHFRSEKIKPHDVMKISQKLLLDGMMPCLELLIQQHHKNEPLITHSGALHECARTTMTLFKYFDLCYSESHVKSDLSFPDLQKLESKCNNLTSQAYQLWYPF